ncbi:MAG: hypothetical protein K0U86_02875 [Planctomycetes bacterium]|nr:hypothetical protein [Planctomycetota bacterium]MCH9723834.1 hypothetical protein [Planctomycetota bacterium]MCH9776261.1 hypothetical protein [Planctomycetota bacterium]MCH9791796.1 hypothetical protein [Planctomycetota bacterium]
MTEPLQSFDWKNSNYERPANTWVCGHMCQSGEPCRLGPDSRGECQLQSQCQPEEKDGKYFCTRSTINGGKCKEGPTRDGTCCQSDSRCQPRRSLFAKRRLLGMIAAMVAALFSLVVFSGSSPSSLLIPGEVTASHANIESDCNACHTAAEGGFATWIHSALDSKTLLNDSERCLKCHSDLGSDALFPHGVSIDRLSKITDQVRLNQESSTAPLALQLSSLTSPPAPKDKLACSTCHQEHHGRKADLTHLTDLQCQTCHTRQFESFEHGHPGLGDYPYQRRSGIYFDHQQHLNRYFKADEFKRTMPQGQKPESCNSCHSADSTGKIMLTGSFKNMCASCHEPQIKDVEFPGIPFFALPVIAPEIMISQGEWPHIKGTFKTARLPRLMELLLEHDPKYQSALQQLGTIDYRILNNLDKKHNAAIVEIAWSVKRLLYDVTVSGELALEQRLGNSHPEYKNLQPSIIPTLLLAQQIWFPDLATEMDLYQENKLIPAQDRAESSQKSIPFTIDNSNGWSLSDSDFTIRYRPLGHADPLLKGWLNRAVQERRASMNSDHLWQIISNPTASGLEDSQGALASGRCLLCHSIDQDSKTGLSQINWLPSPGQHSQERFTDFSHAPHLLTGTQNQCAICHAFEKSESNNTPILKQDYFVRDRSNLFWTVNVNCEETCTSGFQPINQKTCVTCHNKSTATQSCLECHNYHAHTKQRALKKLSTD